MIVGTLSVRLMIRESRSLKDKRQVIKSIKDRLKNSFNLSVAEVDQLENKQLAVLGMAMVCNETHPIKQEFGRILEALRSHPVAEFVDHTQEIF